MPPPSPFRLALRTVPPHDTGEEVVLHLMRQQQYRMKLYAILTIMHRVTYDHRRFLLDPAPCRTPDDLHIDYTSTAMFLKQTRLGFDHQTLTCNTEMIRDAVLLSLPSSKPLDGYRRHQSTISLPMV